MKNLILLLALFLNLISCTMKSEFKDYRQLDQHEGTSNYNIEILFGRDFKVFQPLLNIEKGELNVYGRTNPIDEKDKTSQRLKISQSGDILDKGPTAAGPLKDGTMIGYNFYCDWIINGDGKDYEFIRPITSEDRVSLDSWFKKFQKLYSLATDVYISPSLYDYYMKIDKEWVEVKRDVKGIPLDLEEQYPAKYSNVRMMELRDLCPDFFKARAERDTTFVDIFGYEETDSEKGSGLNPISYSAGDYYLNLYMPLGDTIKIKRHGSMGVNMQFYKIPVTQGGRNDVVFIVQEPNELYPDREFGGMYVVRPRDLNQKQYGPHESSADSYSSQYDSKKGAINTEAKFLKPMKD